MSQVKLPKQAGATFSHPSEKELHPYTAKQEIDEMSDVEIKEVVAMANWRDKWQQIKRQANRILLSSSVFVWAVVQAAATEDVTRIPVAGGDYTRIIVPYWQFSMPAIVSSVAFMALAWSICNAFICTIERNDKPSFNNLR